MLPRRMRLSRQDFSLILGDTLAKRVQSPHFSVVVSKAARGVGVVVSKKVAKTAIARHLLKRQVRAIIRPWYIHALEAGEPSALVVFVRAGGDSLTFPEILAELSDLLRRGT